MEGCKTEIEIQIIAGVYAPGEKQPPIKKISELYNIGNITAQKVLVSLCDDGTVLKRNGVGHFVKPFTNKRLLAAHEEELENRMESIIEYANRLNMSRGKYWSCLNLFCREEANSKICVSNRGVLPLLCGAHFVRNNWRKH